MDAEKLEKDTNSEVNNDDTVKEAKIGLKSQQAARPEQTRHQEISEDENEIRGTKLIILVFSLMAGTFMVSLDKQIIAIAIPKITTDFNSLNDIAWYGSIYLLAQISLQPTVGKLYTILNIKRTYLFALLWFEIGCVICALAPTSVVFILGRAIAGMGTSAIYAGDQTIFVRSVSLLKRPIAMSCLQGMDGIATALSPPLGGVFTDSTRLTWRFCFWFNLPFGAVTAGIFFLTYKAPAAPAHRNTTREKFLQIDILGTTLFTSSMILLLLSLQWGGVAYSWSNAKVWGCLLGFALALCLFIISQIRNQARALIQYRVVSDRTVLASCLFLFALQMSYTVQAYYIPIWFQAVQGASASKSGVQVLPYGISTTLATLSTGFLMGKSRHYVPFMHMSSMIFTIGSSLFHTLTPNTSTGKWVAFEVVAGWGYGMGFQVPFLAVQNVLSSTDAPMGISLLIFSMGLGGSVGLGISQNIFVSSLKQRLEQIPGINGGAVLTAGTSAVGLQNAVPIPLLSAARQAYNDAITTALILAAAAAGSAFLCSLAVEWKRVSKE